MESLTIFTEECSNDDFGLTFSFFSVAMSNLPSTLLYGKRSWILQKILEQKL